MTKLEAQNLLDIVYDKESSYEDKEQAYRKLSELLDLLLEY